LGANVKSQWGWEAKVSRKEKRLTPSKTGETQERNQQKRAFGKVQRSGGKKGSGRNGESSKWPCRKIERKKKRHRRPRKTERSGGKKKMPQGGKTLGKLFTKKRGSIQRVEGGRTLKNKHPISPKKQN